MAQSHIISLGNLLIMTILPVVAQRNYGHFATLDTVEVRPWQNTDHRQVSKFTEYPNESVFNENPQLVEGFNLIDFGHTQTFRVVASADTNALSSRVANLHIDTWGDTKMYTAEADWFYTLPSEQQIQTGKWNVTYTSRQENQKWIPFNPPYSKPPKIIVWIRFLDMAGGRNLRIVASYSDVTNAGFLARLDTWSDSVLYSAGLSWIAHPEDMPGVFSGSYQFKEGYKRISFPANKFQTGVPQVVAAFSNLDIDGVNRRVLRVKTGVDHVSKIGLTPYVFPLGDTILYDAGMSFIAYLP